MTVKVIGERAYAYYRKHAPAASILLQDGDALDGGTAIDIDSNLGHLEYESTRHLVTSLGDSQSSFTTATLAFAGYDDVPPPLVLGAEPPPCSQLMWGPNVCCRFGPFDIIADRVIQAGNEYAGRFVLRKIQMRMDAYAESTDHIFTHYYFALTNLPDREALFRGNYLAIERVLGSTGRATYSTDELSFVANIPVTPALEGSWPCRATSALGAVESIVVPVYLWFGWRFLNLTNQPCAINSMSAWEKRLGSE